MLKIMALGFCFNGPESYLRTFENGFDFIIVLSALLAMPESDQGAMQLMGKLKTLRVMRVVRPLRIVSRSENLKIAINALIVSIPQLINLTIFVLLFFFLFGIFGVNYFKGTYYTCFMDNIPDWAQESLITSQDCMDYGGDWIRKDSNFDNIGHAIVTMFKVALTEGWLDIMYWGMDSVGEGKLMVRDT